MQLSIALSALITPPLRAPAPDMQAGTCAALRLTHDDVNQLSKAVKSTYLEAGIKRGLTGAVLPTAETEVLVMLHGSRARVKSFASWCATLLDGANVELEEDNDGCPAYQLTSRFPLITPDEGCGSKPSQVEVQLHATSDDEELGYLRRHLRLQVRFSCFAFFDRAPTLINAPLSRNSRRPRFTARSATRWICRAARHGSSLRAPPPICTRSSAGASAAARHWRVGSPYPRCDGTRWMLRTTPTRLHTLRGTSCSRRSG